MKKLFFCALIGLGFASSALMASNSDFAQSAENPTVTEEVGPKTFIIDGDGNVFYFDDGSNCLIDLRDGNVYGDC